MERRRPEDGGSIVLAFPLATNRSTGFSGSMGAVPFQNDNNLRKVCPARFPGSTKSKLSSVLAKGYLYQLFEMIRSIDSF